MDFKLNKLCKKLLKRFFPKRRKIIGTVTYSPSFKAFVDFVHGKKTLKEFRNVKTISITKPIYEDCSNEKKTTCKNDH